MRRFRKMRRLKRLFKKRRVKKAIKKNRRIYASRGGFRF